MTKDVRIRSIVKDSDKLRNALLKRWKDVFGKKYVKGREERLLLTNKVYGIKTAVADDAINLGRKDIQRSKISRYINDPYSAGALNEDQILWLAVRWQIPVELVVGEAKEDVKYYIPKPYNEAEALKKLKEIYGHEKTDTPGA